MVMVGDVVVGVSGVATIGFDAASVQRAIVAAQAVTTGGGVVLHLSDRALHASMVEELATQIAGAAAQLLGSKMAVETVQSAVAHAIAQPTLAITMQAR